MHDQLGASGVRTNFGPSGQLAAEPIYRFVCRLETNHLQSGGSTL
jgi:hypothetical protein